MIQSVLISGELNDARLARALGELADLSSASKPARQPVMIFLLWINIYGYYQTTQSLNIFIGN